MKAAIAIFSAVVLSGCASFMHAPSVVRGRYDAASEQSRVPPFKTVELSWTEVPVGAIADELDTTADRFEPSPQPVSADDMKYLRREAEKILGKARLYDPQNGEGEIKISLASNARWNYRRAFRSIFVDTQFIFILPSSLITSHEMSAETSRGGKYSNTASVKTVFHVLMIPLYPFAMPSSREHAAIKQMLWNLTYQIHASK